MWEAGGRKRVQDTAKRSKQHICKEHPLLNKYLVRSFNCGFNTLVCYREKFKMTHNGLQKQTVLGKSNSGKDTKLSTVREKC